MKNNIALGFFILFLVYNIYYSFSNDYLQRRYVVKMNGADITYHLDEEYVLSSVPIFVHVKNWRKETIYNENLVSMSTAPLGYAYLTFENLDCNSSYTTKRISCSTTDAHMVVVKNDIIPDKVVIQHKGEVIYNGEFKTDFNDIIKTPGRYYFNLYLSTSDKFLEKTTSLISFQVKFVGGKK